MQAPLRELATGTHFAGRYQVIEELGRGGMGRVYKVHDTELNEKVALKLLRPEVAADAEAVERFRNELKSARTVVHRNVCRMFDIGRAEGTPFITMEYVHGEDLKRLIRKIGQLPAGRAVSIARQIAEGLAEAHATASSTATSSLRTSWSTRAAASTSWISASPARSRRRASPGPGS